MMKGFFRNIALLFSVFGVLSCSGTVDDGGADGPDEVPEGVLRIFADKTSIAADGVEMVTGCKTVTLQNLIAFCHGLNGVKETLGNCCLGINRIVDVVNTVVN